jgi:hypothetical protein
MYTSNAVIKDKRDPDRRFYFMACIKSYSNMYTCFDVIESVVQGLLAMGMTNGLIGLVEANRLILELQAKRPHLGPETKSALRRVKGSFIIDRDLALRDKTAATVDTMVDKFEEITLFNQFIDETGLSNTEEEKSKR